MDIVLSVFQNPTNLHAAYKKGLIIRDRWATANGKAPTDLNQPAKTGVTWERGVGGKAETLKGTWEGIDVWASSITRAEEAHMANFQ
ncbi:hypothetical protein GOBAR_DD35785 [Gossypium barbadense]|nr:hypothetical protein GOBAR_DD35785 [Gossypium barbadense]